MRKRWYSAALVPAMLLTLTPALPAAAAASKLPTPEVEWLTQDTELDGRKFKAGQVVLKNIPQDIMPDYQVEITNTGTGQVVETYSDGFGGYTRSVQEIYVGWYTEEQMPTGSYTATVTYLGDDGATYTDSEPATTAVYQYTNPGVSYAVPTGVEWDGANFAYTLEDAVLAENANLFIQFAKVQEDGTYMHIGYKGDSAQYAQSSGNATFLERFNDRVTRYGPGDYVFRIRVISWDLTQKYHSEWSAWSQPRTVSGTTGEIAGSLEDILTDLGSSPDESAKQAAIDAVRALDQEKLEESLSADQAGTGVAAQLRELEEKLGLTAGVAVDPTYHIDVDTTRVTVAGAGLNAKDLSTPPTLTFSNPPKELEIPNTYRDYVQMDLSLGDTVATNPDGTLLVPIQITMPVPDGIDHTKLQILHFHDDGVTRDLITPYCFQDGSQWMARFTVNRLSPFVFAEYEPFFTVTLDPMGGTVTPATLTTGEDGRLTQALPTPTRTDHDFNGWFTQGTGGVQVNQTYVFTADTTIYAHWTARQPSGGGGGSTGGGGGGGSTTTYYGATVEAADHGSVTLSSQNAAKGTTVTITVTPDQGYELASLTVTDKDGKTVALTDKGDGKFTFVMPGSKVTVKAVFQAVEEPEPQPQPLPFADVAEGAWYADAVRYVYEKGLMTGTGDGAFSPDQNLTRGMLVTMLYRLAGQPAQSGTGAPFTDVAADAWYADGVNWAAANGVAGGYGGGVFGPGDPITREQLVTMLCRYVQSQGGDVTAGGDLSAYRDGEAVSDYARSAMEWACGQGLIQGSSGALNPQGTATRAEVAQLMANYLGQN